MNAPEPHFNLFSRLFKYRPRPNRVAVEDFLTEAYASVLLSDKRAAAEMLSELFGLVVPLTDDFTLRTQGQYEGDRPDMEFQDSRHWILQENKVGSGFGDSQIERYRRLLKPSSQGPPERLVVTCVLWGEPPQALAPPRCHAIRWSNVYTAVASILERNKVDFAFRMLWEQFLGFLKERGMEPFRGLTSKHLCALQQVESLRASSWHLLEAIKCHFQDGYDVETRAVKASDGKVDVCQWAFLSNGLKILPWIEFNSTGIFFVLGLMNSNDSPAFEAVKDLQWIATDFRPEGWHLIARATPDEVATGFLDSGPAEQIVEVGKWLDSKLDGLVANGYLNRKSNSVQPPLD